MSFSSRCQAALNPITACIRSVVKQPATYTLSVLSSVSGALYSLTFPSRTQPQDISAAWWRNMSAGQQTFAIINALVSMGTTTLTNMKYLPRSWQQLQTNLKHYCESYSSFLLNSASLVLGLAAGLIYGAQAFDAFLWTHIAASILSGALNFLSYTARRYSGIIELIDTVKDLFGRDAKTQHELIAQLNRLKPEFRAQLDQHFQNQAFNTENVEIFLTYLQQHADNTWLQPNISHSTLRYSVRLSTKIAAGLFCALPALIVGIQNGYQGIEIISGGATKDLSPQSKIALGSVPGFVNALFYFISAYKYDQSLADMFNFMKRDPATNTLKVLLLLGCNGLTSSGYYTIASAVASDTLLGLQPTSGLGAMLPALYTGSVALGSINNTDNFFQTDQPVNVEEVSRYLTRTPLPSATLAGLKQHGIFKPLAAEMKPAVNDAAPRQAVCTAV